MSPETIDAMIAAGASAEVIGAAWKAEIASQQRVMEERRAKDAERQRRHRGSRDVTVTGGGVTDKGSLEVSPQTPLPKPSKISPLSPPNFEERREATATCLRRAFPPMEDLPEWMPESFLEFRAMRRSMRNVPYGPSAERRCIAKLTKLRAEGHDPDKLISKAVERGHRTFFEDETTKFGKQQRVLTSQEWREQAEFYTRRGNQTQADECRQKAIELETREAA